jgi:Protein of unknown function (DUF2970)
VSEEDKGGLIRAALAVFWSFFGVRRKAHYEQDAIHLKPAQVIVAGLIGALILVLAILGLVLWITG